MQLTHVPSFTFHQGMAGDENHENSIRVEYYNGNVISLRQHRGSDIEEDVLINLEHLEALYKAIKKFRKEAHEALGRK